jgi:hypothetical protein
MDEDEITLAATEIRTQHAYDVIFEDIEDDG